jgi:hypothetical protein
MARARAGNAGQGGPSSYPQLQRYRFTRARKAGMDGGSGKFDVKGKREEQIFIPCFGGEQEHTQVVGREREVGR